LKKKKIKFGLFVEDSKKEVVINKVEWWWVVESKTRVKRRFNTLKIVEHKQGGHAGYISNFYKNFYNILN
jgi:hypothetical protein